MASEEQTNGEDSIDDTGTLATVGLTDEKHAEEVLEVQSVCEV